MAGRGERYSRPSCLHYSGRKFMKYFEIFGIMEMFSPKMFTKIHEIFWE